MTLRKSFFNVEIGIKSENDSSSSPLPSSFNQGSPTWFSIASFFRSTENRTALLSYCLRAMWCFRITAFAAVMFGEKVLCRAVHDGASTSIVSTKSPSSTNSIHTVSFTTTSISPSSSSSSSSSSTPSSISSSPSTFITSPISPSSSSSSSLSLSYSPTTQAQPQVTASNSSSPIPTTLSDTKGEETTTHPPTTQPTSVNTTAQIVAIAIGSSAIVGVVAAFFFFAGRRSNRRSSMHNVAPNLGSFRTKLDKRWRKNSSQNVHSGHATAAPAEFGTVAEVREVSLPPERPINNEPYFYHPVTVASSLARELDGSSIISYNPPPAARLQPQRNTVLPIELPASYDPGNSPLPEYEELDAARRRQIFSWAAAPEATYHPDKFAPSNMI
ncbi:hypothetical protein M441DRAFT_40671 [Trichoderma asperellum CBS 433.97]|uniref:Uncharacterized protein n=1 Tax=Trichoderma asperellum (strain ATCC 204424 / CBS 433.97 / NBRC 101777) TaxID=1042311 RepID=A0A2T3YVJ2_TRIA4|nr:hypothetical protein M441DRAFT_40671 [Trichoderma asperellum CBS 433.97]PTB36564.1 hypothetical protein M441DRAFT_40671 [Trichoderma asperellum CBS 433.97]